MAENTRLRRCSGERSGLCRNDRPYSTSLCDNIRAVGKQMSTPRIGSNVKREQILIGTVAVLGFLSATARIATAFYYSVAMPRSPEPWSGRVYRVGAAFNTPVYV